MKLHELKAQRAEVEAKLSAVLDMTPKDDAEDEVLLAEAEGFKAELVKIDRRLDLAAKIDAAAKAAAKPIDGGADALDLMTGGVKRPPARVEGKKQDWEQPGIGFARFVKCWAASGQNHMVAEQLAKHWYPDDGRLQFKAALLQNSGTGGGFLVPEEQSRELVQYLRQMAKIRPVARIVPISGTMVMPVQTAGVAAAYIGESVDDNAQDLSFGQRRLVARKLRALVAVSNDLLRNSSPEADTIVRDDLAGGLAEAEDLAFIRATGVGDSPKGMRYWAASSAVNNGTGTTAAAIEVDLINMAQRLATAMKGQMRTPRWFMPSRSFYKLYGLRDSTSGNLLFPEVREATPRLLGYPISVADQIPVNLGSGTSTEIYLVDTSEMIIGEEMGISVAVSDVASYKDSGGTLQSAFSLDQTVLRAISKHDFIMRRDEAVQVLYGTNTTW